MKIGLNSIGTQTKAGTLAKRMTAYSLAAGAGILMSSDAAADVTAINIEFPTTIGAGDFFDLDVDGDGFSDFSFFDSYSGYIQLLGLGLNNGFADTSYGAPGPSIIFPVDTVFDQSYSYNSQPNPIFSDQSGFLGLKFEINPGGPDGGDLGPAGDPVHYGYLNVSFDLDQNNLSVITINGGAYQSTPNTGIAAGANPIPEPTGLSLLAIGSVGLATWRRRKN